MDELISELKSEPCSCSGRSVFFHFHIIITAPLLIFPVIPHKCALGSIFREFTNTSFKSDSVFFGSIISSNAQLYIFYNSMHKINVCATKFVCCCLMLYRGNRAVDWDSQHNQCNDWVSSVYRREMRLWALPSVIIPRLSSRHLHIVLL